MGIPGRSRVEGNIQTRVLHPVRRPDHRVDHSAWRIKWAIGREHQGTYRQALAALR